MIALLPAWSPDVVPTQFTCSDRDLYIHACWSCIYCRKLPCRWVRLPERRKMSYEMREIALFSETKRGAHPAFRPFSWLSWVAEGGNVNIFGLSSVAHIFPKYQATKLGMDFATWGTFSDIYCRKKQPLWNTSAQPTFPTIFLIVCSLFLIEYRIKVNGEWRMISPVAPKTEGPLFYSVRKKTPVP